MFSFTDLNYVAVLVAFVYIFGLGMLWYGPFFGKCWMGYVNSMYKKFTPDKSMVGALVMSALTNFVAAVVVAIFVDMISPGDWLDALLIAVYATVGFASFPLLSAVIWEKRPFGMYLINAGYSLAAFTGAAIIITVM